MVKKLIIMKSFKNKSQNCHKECKEWRLGSTRYKEIYFSPEDYVDKKTETDKAQMEKHSISNLFFYCRFRTMWSKFV